ncbi:glycosyltransferase family protein 64 C3-like [Chenopodium quinoa]|uniref:glycosyltransferase family protein 64 C3-like n=1 Tax=Chenopodium quinoa TaxID=63459 RepID=UPI000B783F47|nr:glycosyltransferase family protein 64 C3-like [Chenopodium quinoa]
MEVRRRYIFSLLKFIIILHLPPSTLSHRSLSLNLNPLCDRKTLPNPQSLRSDQLTVLINGYSELRISLLSTIAGVYAASPVIAAVVVLWGNPSTPAETLDSLSSNFSLLYSAGAPVTVVRQKSNSLNSRFLPRRWIRTRGVLICDDDVEVDPKSIEFAFKVWQVNQDRLIGLFARSHSLDLRRKEWIYTVHQDRYSIVLTKFLMLNVDFLYLYSCGREGLEGKFRKLRGVVDKMCNCEDILMNFMVADVTEQGPLLVGAERVRDWGDARNEVVIKKREKEVGVGLSGVKRGLGKHRKRRGECIREFHKVLGRMSLRYSYGTVVSPINEQGLCEKGGKLVPCDQQIFE